jgi:aryl-alcohol dehydrogenase-like predicted oxidoreductase
MYMQRRRLGKTNLNVSGIGLGTAGLGMEYGIKEPKLFGKSEKKRAEQIIEKALSYDINLFDTAPAYGDSEKILGSVLKGVNCYVATKVGVPSEGIDVRKHVIDSVEGSMKNLQRQRIDIVQIHNATVHTISETDMPKVLLDMRKQGLIGFIGASVYGVENAMEVIKSGLFDVVQIAYNLLDKRMKDKVIPLAEKSDIGVMSRSVYFQGVLTPKAEHLGEHLKPLSDMAIDVKKKLGRKDMREVARMALKFCLSTSGIGSVLVGTKTEEHLDFAIQYSDEGNLSEHVLKKISEFKIKNIEWLDPRNWPKD